MGWIGRLILLSWAACLASQASAQFVDEFDQSPLPLDPKGRSGWTIQTGDGEAGMRLTARNGVAAMTIDARKDRRDIWWAFIRHSVSPYIDARELSRPGRELRVEARVRTAAAPRRINMHFNHSRTTDFHSHLMEYDLPDTGWHTISFTTKGFDATPADEIFLQMAMIDWGRDLFTLDIDYVKVSVVDPVKAGPDLGNPLPYRPRVPNVTTLQYHLPVAEAAMVDAAYPDVSFATWADMSGGTAAPAISVSGTQTMIFRPDLSAYRGRKAQGWGVLELTTESVQWAGTELEEFGYLRALEILGGDPAWKRASVTRDSLLGSTPEDRLLGQMFIDVPPAMTRGGKNYILVSPPVLDRLLSGRTKGIAVIAQGAVNATFASSASADPARRPKLHFSLR